MKITTIGVDLAKEVFQIHGVDAHGKAVLRKQLRRSEMAKYFAKLEPCLIGMEALEVQLVAAKSGNLLSSKLDVELTLQLLWIARQVWLQSMNNLMNNLGLWEIL